MINATATKADGTALYIFGLSDENIRRLREGSPIAFSLSEMGGSGDVVITWGKTEREIAKCLEPFMGPDTEVRPSKS